MRVHSYIVAVLLILSSALAKGKPEPSPSSMKATSLKVISVPPGANLKVDGQDSGVTPKIVYLTIGTHNLELSKEGFATGTTPVEITPDELPGGSVTIELGGLSRDTVEMRDGSVLQGDVLSMSMVSVVLRVDGKDQSHDRNQVKKIILVQREVTQQPAIVQPLSGQQK
jgi:PEGA domain